MSKIWKWLVILLVILNITLLTTLWLKPHPKMPMMHRGGPASELLIHKLKFSPEQVKQFEVLKEEHQHQIQTLQRKGHEYRDSYFDLLKSDTVDEQLINEKSMIIAVNQKGIEMATFNHFKKVRALCNEEQKKIFDSIISEVIMRMSGPPKGPIGPGGPPPPPMH